jgi:glycosyltransferase involved in cell wall biosynthesis
MPVYNGADVLGVAINSILTQTLTDFELLVVNDGSKDTTSQVARSFNDPRIRVIDLATNQGLINALNTGLAEARGEFLARMDHDDIAHPERLQQQIAAMTVSGAVICGSAYQRFGAISGPPITCPLTDTDIRAALPVVSPFAHPTVTMRTEVCRRLGYSSTAKHHEDYELWWRLSNEGTMINLPEVLLRYRVHSGQISAKYRDLQRTGTAVVAVSHLREEGRFRHEYDLHCHNRAISYLPLASLDELEAVGDWLYWLRNSFQTASVDLATRYDRVWRSVCLRQPHLGIRLWGIYKRFLIKDDHVRDDLFVLLTAYGRIGVEDKGIKFLRRILSR